MDPGVRLSVGVGLGAFALSVIIALFSGVALGALIIRALLLGVFFGAAVFGAVLLLKRLTPELFEESIPVPSSQGTHVDIVLPGGDEALGEDQEAGADVQAGDSSQVMASEAEPTGRTDHIAPPEESRPEVQAASEPAAPRQVQKPSSQSLETEVSEIRKESLITDSVSEPSNSASAGRTLRPSLSTDEIDVLPDLDSLSDSFTTEIPGQGESGNAPLAVSADFSAGSDKGDPAVLAKAVQTLLRRDQKGQ